MNTYQVTWYPPTATNPATQTVQAQWFGWDGDELVFYTDGGTQNPILVVSRSLAPVVLRTT